MGKVQAIRPKLEVERAAAALIDATSRLATAMTQAAAAMPSESFVEAAVGFLTEARHTEMARPARLTLEAVASALLAEWAHSTVDEAEPPDDDPGEEIAA